MGWRHWACGVFRAFWWYWHLCLTHSLTFFLVPFSFFVNFILGPIFCWHWAAPAVGPSICLANVCGQEDMWYAMVWHGMVRCSMAWLKMRISWMSRTLYGAAYLRAANKELSPRRQQNPRQQPWTTRTCWNNARRTKVLAQSMPAGLCLHTHLHPRILVPIRIGIRIRIRIPIPAAGLGHH